jgi:hypothetical protein
MLDLDSLEAKAKAATPGPWRYGYEPGFCGELIDPTGEMIASFADEPAARDAEFIAAANPAAILALIRELREARANESRFWIGFAEKAVAAEREACAEGVRSVRRRIGEVSIRASAMHDALDCAEQAISARGAKGGE